MVRFLSTLLVLLGIILILWAGYLIWQRNNPQRVAFNSYVESGFVATSYRMPVTLIIASLNMRLPIKPAKITDGKWEASNDAISYLSTSPIPGEWGNSILYGHNWSNLLGNLTKVTPGQNIEIVYSDGSRSIFTVAYTAVVTPDQTHILSSSQDRRITLYTCTGFLDRKRLVATAILQEN